MILLISFVSYDMNTLFPKTNITCDFLNVLCNIHIVRHYDAESFNCQLERESERESFVQLCFLVNEHLWIKYWFGRLYVVAKLYRYSSQVCVCVCVCVLKALIRACLLGLHPSRCYANLAATLCSPRQQNVGVQSSTQNPACAENTALMGEPYNWICFKWMKNKNELEVILSHVVHWSSQCYDFRRYKIINCLCVMSVLFFSESLKKLNDKQIKELIVFLFFTGVYRRSSNSCVHLWWPYENQNMALHYHTLQWTHSSQCLGCKCESLFMWIKKILFNISHTKWYATWMTFYVDQNLQRTQNTLFWILSPIMQCARFDHWFSLQQKKQK